MHIGLARRGYSATGGAEAYLKRFARALLAGGHTCTLFTSAEWPDWPGDRIERLPGRSPLEFADALQTARQRVPCDSLFSLERVWTCDAYRAGDGVHRAWLARRDAVEPFWKRWSRGLNPKHRQLLTLEARLFSPEGAGKIITNCRMVRDEIVRAYGYPAERISVVYNGLPAAPAVEPGLREQTRARLGLGAADFAVLFAGSGWERKGLRTAIDGIAQVRAAANPVLLVAGRGNPRRYRGGGGRVRFLGPVREMAACYAAADLFVLPTLYDPFSNACLEALAAGLPVVTTAANGFSEILRPGETGEVLAEPSDAAGLARAVEAWSDPVRRAAARPRLLELARGFTIEANVRETLAVLGW
ncbi:MAG: glycosyltransferase family 4 protein [Chthoniobacteraceae bacterium]|nr:glycosyltransferase family 4 protein [Chthoniobacteraceae bacterium]